MIKTLKYKLNSSINVFLFNREKEKKRKEILSFYSHNPPKDEGTKAALNYLRKHPLSNFYGDFQEQYCADEIEVYTDNENGLKYVIEENKRLYFKKSQNKRTIQLIYNQLRIEQDPESPHCYTDEHFFVNKETILADVGCAEGYFSFQHIEDLNQAYLFESDPEWIEALEATFKQWNDKVEIIRKFVSDKTNDNEVNLNAFYGDTDETPNFYKIDVEGAEASVLKGMKGLLRKPPLQIALCTYHNGEDLEKFTSFFTKNGFSVYPNPGLMIFMNDMQNMHPPYFRTGLIKATKHE